MANEPQTILNQLGMEPPDIFAAIKRAQSLSVDAATVRIMAELSDADLNTDHRKSDVVHATSSCLTKTGLAAMTLRSSHHPDLL